MKQVTAIIQPLKLYTVLMALREIPEMPGLVVSEIRVFPSCHRDAISHGHGIHALDSIEIVKLECVVEEDIARLVVDTIANAARTGGARDGKITIAEVEDVVTIRPGQSGQEAF